MGRYVPPEDCLLTEELSLLLDASAWWNHGGAL
jgi:hypothetical protein